MKRIINPKTIAKQMKKRELAEQEAILKAESLTDEEKDNIQATILRELTAVCTNRIRLLEKVLGRKVSISTSTQRGYLISEPGSDPAIYDDSRTFSITVK